MQNNQRKKNRTRKFASFKSNSSQIQRVVYRVNLLRLMKDDLININRAAGSRCFAMQLGSSKVASQNPQYYHAK